MRFVTSKWAVRVCQAAGFQVFPATKRYIDSATDIEVARCDGWAVNANKAQLEKLKLISNGCPYNYDTQTVIYQ